MAFKIAVVMSAFNAEDYISQSIDSIVNQSIGFEDNIQLIVVNDKSSDKTGEIAKRYQIRYPDNVSVITNDVNSGAAHSRNVGLKYVDAEFVNFLDSDDVISQTAFKKAYDFLKGNSDADIVSIPIYFFGAKKGPHSLNYKFEKTQVVNLEENPSYIQLSGASSFFRFSTLVNYRFNENLRVSEDPLLINQILLDNPKIGFIHDEKYLYRKYDAQTSLIATSAQHRSYFTTRVNEYFINLIHYSIKKYNYVPKFIQYTLMYDLQWILEIKYVHYILSSDEISGLYDKLFYILSYIDDDVIYAQLSLPIELKEHIVLLKHHRSAYLKNKDSYQEDKGLNTVYIDNFEFISDSEVYISGILTDFIKDSQVTALVGDVEYPTNELDFPQRNNFSLNFDYAYNHNFEVILPIKEDVEISFKTKRRKLNIDYNETSRLSRVGKYRLSKDYLAIDGVNHIEIIKKNPLKVISMEFGVLREMIAQKEQGWRTGVILRILYILTHPIFKFRKIWIFQDLPNSAEDNSFYLFECAQNSKDLRKINKFYVLSKSHGPDEDLTQIENEYMASPRKVKIKKLLGLEIPTAQYKNLKKRGKVLAHKSLKHRLYMLYADIIITSHPDNPLIYPFWGNYNFLAGLSKSKTVFLQHGVTKDNIAHWLNAYEKRIDLISTVSDKERDSFFDSNYGYSQDTVKTLGFPRFDFLEKLDDKKEIVFMPTWRRQFDSYEKEKFTQTSFFKQINQILGDEDLINYIESRGYKMLFKPHRNIYKFLDVFDIHPSIKLANKISYRDIFNHSSLIISDFSSVVFDFAYLKKPVIYYQPDNDYHFNVENAYFKYDTMGFGPVTNNLGDLKTEIKKIIDNGGQMSDVYIKRVDEFFKYNDNNNCQRVLDAILDINDYY